MKTRRVGAYGICRDAEGRVLLVRGSATNEFPGLWSLPGGGVEQGEHPDDAVVREFAEETGLSVHVDGPRTVTADVTRLPNGDLEHADRVIYDVSAVGGSVTPETNGSSDEAAWFADPATVPLLPFTAALLGLGGRAPGGRAPGGRVPGGRVPGGPASGGPASGGPASGDRESLPVSAEEPLARPRRFQRFGAYAAATDPAGRILLARIAPGYPGAGLWHAPGGGTDHGETPEQALERELFEETSQHGRVIRLLGISHRYDRSAVGPEGVPLDWHAIRVLFRVEIDSPTDPVITEESGSTEAAAWFTPAEVEKLELTELAREAVNRITLEGTS